LSRVAEGETLRQVCADLKDFGCPTAGRFCQRVLEDDEFAKRYARARKMQCEAWADKIYLEGEHPRIGEKTKTMRTEEGKEMAVLEVQTGDNVDRSRLKIDAMKWLLARLHPEKYGDKVALTGADGKSPVQVQWMQ
jgi:hypothetical protein